MFQSLMILTKEYFDFVCILYGWGLWRFYFYSKIEIVILGYLVSSTAHEGLFSSAPRLKMWYLSRMGDDRFCNLAVSVTSGDHTASL